MLKLSIYDYSIIVFYFFVVVTLGFLQRLKASKNLFSFFVANREYGWIWVGTSIVATTFSADTPLAVSGITAKSGISGNWFWWSWVLTYMTITIFYSRLWWRSSVITDVELTEIRYSGKEAIILRLIKAFYFSIVLNGIILGWVFLSIKKILIPFLDSNYNIEWFRNIYPEFLLIGDYHQTLVLLVLVFIVILYSSLSGVRGGVLNDMIQFIIAMGGSIFFSFYAVKSVGGVDSLKKQIQELYPEHYESILSFIPSLKDMGYILLIYFLIQWWTQYYSDGTGYILQRMNTAKSEKDAQLGSIWFTFANFSIRTWPWVFIGLVGLVVFPENPNICNHEWCKEVLQDREYVYPVLIQFFFKESLWKGILLLGLFSAFMSTAETHLNWGASYIANDFYKRFINPYASDKQLIFVSKIGIFFMAFYALLIASKIETISNAWKFLISISAGIGLPQMLRWFWWRVNPYTEISGMISSFILSIFFYNFFPDWKAETILFFIALLSGCIILVVTMITKPSDKKVLLSFYKKTQPCGFWGPISGKHTIQPLWKNLFFWILGNVSILSFMLSIGYLIFSEYLYFFINFFISLISGIPVIKELIKKT